MIPRIVISTRDRHSQVLDAIRSFQQAHAQAEITVFDQSDTRYALPVARVCRPANVAGYIEELTKKGFPKEVLEFGLVGGYGGYRNVALLDSVGDRVLSTDDDTQARLYAPPDQDTERIFFGSPVQPYQDWYESREEWQDGGLTFVTDVLGQHDKILGLPTIWPGVTTRVVMSGLVGDCAAAHNYFMLFTKGEARNRLMRRYKIARETREGLQAVQSTIVTRGNPWFRSLCFSYDATRPLPPFMPNGRGECGVFAVLLSRMHDTAIGYLPWAIEHVPPSRAGFQNIAFGNDAMFYNLAELAGVSGYADLARALAACGNMPLGMVRDFVEDRHRANATGYIREAHRCLEYFGTKDAQWAEDIQAFAAKAAEPLNYSDEKLLELQYNASQFGRFLGLWFEVWETAKSLREVGIRPSVEV